MLEMKGCGGGGEVFGGGVVSGVLVYCGWQGIDEQCIVEIKQLYGFDKLLVECFWIMFKGFFIFDFGKSFYYYGDVWILVKFKFLVFISIGLWIFLLSYLILVLLGIVKVVCEGSCFDIVIIGLVLVGYFIFGFVLGVFLLVLFVGGSFVQWFLLCGFILDNWVSFFFIGKIIDYLWYIILLVFVLVIGVFVVIIMFICNIFFEEICK